MIHLQISSLIVPDGNVCPVDDNGADGPDYWWYILPETGYPKRPPGQVSNNPKY